MRRNSLASFHYIGDLDNNVLLKKLYIVSLSSHAFIVLNVF